MKDQVSEKATILYLSYYERLSKTSLGATDFKNIITTMKADADFVESAPEIWSIVKNRVNFPDRSIASVCKEIIRNKEEVMRQAEEEEQKRVERENPLWGAF